MLADISKIPGSESGSIETNFPQSDQNLESKKIGEAAGEASFENAQPKPIDLAPDLEHILHSPQGDETAEVPTAEEPEEDHEQFAKEKTLEASNLESLLANSGDEVMDNASDVQSRANKLHGA